MKVTMTVAITQSGGNDVRNVCKEVNLPFVPRVGMEILCPAWKYQRKVENVTLNFGPDYEVESLLLDMGIDETNTKSSQDRLIDTYISNGWTPKEQ